MFNTGRGIRFADDALHPKKTMDCIVEKKNLLRSKILRLRNALSTRERQDKSRCIQTCLFRIPDIIEAQNIFIYVSFKSEVQTHEMIKALLLEGKNIIVPVTDMVNKRLMLSRISDFDADLKPGVMGILEPVREKMKTVSQDSVDIVIAPGVAFSREGWRIGYGGGFYDRFFRETPKRSYALAFELQIVSDLPYDPKYDVPVDCIVTEERVICCSKNES